METTTDNPPSLTLIDVVTPTCNRPADLIEQAKRLGAQLKPCDRWVIVDDCSAAKGRYDVVELLRAFESAGGNRRALQLIDRQYVKQDQLGTVQATRHLGCSMARADALIVEVDDHDLLHDGAIDAIRATFDPDNGAVFVYGDVVWCSDEGKAVEVFHKEDHRRWMLRDSHCPTEGVRAFPKRLYDDVGGYRWEGRVGVVNECEFPGGDYALFMRMEIFLDGFGFKRVPQVLCNSVKVVGGISTRYSAQQSAMAERLRKAAKAGALMIPKLSEPLEAVAKAV